MPETPQLNPSVSQTVGNAILSRKKRICPVRLAASLDNKIRRWLQDPKKILGPYIRTGMAVVDFGCGPGFFTVEIANMVGKSGKVFAVDVQEGMLDKLRDKIKGTDIESRIHIHKCDVDRIGIVGPVDIVIAFYVMHEVSHQDELMSEIYQMIKDNGYLFLIEPKLFHVSRGDFEQTVRNAIKYGFEHVENIQIFFSRGVILRKCQTMTKCSDAAG